MKPILYKASITREQFLYNEMRITAQVILSGLDPDEARKKIIEENLYQCAKVESTKSISRGCIERCKLLTPYPQLIEFLATGNSILAKQTALYAFMLQYRVVWEFFVDIIGKKYSTGFYEFYTIEVDRFLENLQETQEEVRKWSPATISKIRQVLIKTLVDTKILENRKSKAISPILLELPLETAIIQMGNEEVLPAFNLIRR